MKHRAACLILFIATCVQAAPALFAEAEVTPPSPLVQEQGVYTLRFFQGSDVRDIALHPPQARLANVQPLGPVRTHETMRDGKRYRLHERDYAVIPFASGKLDLTEAHISGKLPGTAAASRWSPAPSTISVRPIPLNADADRWLPAVAVRLTEQWAPHAESLKPGDSLRRMLRIEAVGVDAAQLPELELSIPGTSVVPHPPLLSTRVVGQRLVARREQSYDIVPRQPGTLVIPALALPWWQLDRNHPQHVMLPERQLEIAGATPTAAPDTSSALQPRTALLLLVGSLPLWGVWRLRFLLLLWLSLLRKDAAATRNALLRWATHRWPGNPPLTLLELTAHLQPASALAIRQLDRQLYGNGVKDGTSSLMLVWPRARSS